MSNDNESGGSTGGVVSPYVDGLKTQEIKRIFVSFMAMPNPDKCEFLGIPFNAEKKQYAERPQQKHFAKKFGISEKSLSTWKHSEDFDKAVRRVRTNWGKEKTPDVLAALYRRCVTHGNAYDVELWLAYFEGWDRKQVAPQRMESFTADDLRMIISTLPQDKQDEWYVKIGELIALSDTIGVESTLPENKPE